MGHGPLANHPARRESVLLSAGGKFGEATRVPVLLNTSYNLRGEPIVWSPANAYRTFSNSGLDMLVMEKFLLTK